MRTLLSIFDFTGTWSAPFAEDPDWQVIQVDLKHGQDVKEFCCEWITENWLDGYGVETVDGILLAPPCTDLAYSGAWTFPAKDADGRSAASQHLVYQGLRTVEYLKPDFWALEQPRGRIQKLCPEVGAPRLEFDPCDYAGWLNPSDKVRAKLEKLRLDYGGISAAEVEFTRKWNAYTKRTQLYGMFNLPAKRRLEPVRVCGQGSWLQRLGGKTEKTKAQRSATPAGFAQAFYQANKDRRLDWEGMDERREEWADAMMPDAIQELLGL